MRRPGHDELYAFELLERLLGVKIDHFDTGTADRQGVVDGIFESSDGRAGAVEVTTLTASSARSVEGLLAKTDSVWELEGVEGYWHVEVSPEADLRKVRSGLAGVLRWCETNGIGVWGYSHWPYAPGVEKVGEWLHGNGVEILLRRTDTSDVRGTRIIASRPLYSSDSSDIPEVSNWLSQELRKPLLASKLRKLRHSGSREKHLFVFLEPWALPEGIFDALVFRSGVPEADLPVHDVTHLWLLPRYSWSALVWVASEGWARVPRHGLYEGARLLTDENAPVTRCRVGAVLSIDGSPLDPADRQLRSWAALTPPAHERWPDAR